MNNISEVKQAVFIGLIVAIFLINTSRVLKAIELCKEGLSILDNKAVMKEHPLITTRYKEMNWTLLKAYTVLGDYTNWIKYTRKLIDFYNRRGERTEECTLSIKLAVFCLHLSKYAEAKELCEKALVISIETGQRKLEAHCYSNLGMVFQLVGEYKKAREYHEKSLVIKREIGDKRGEAVTYGRLGAVFQSLREHEKAKGYLQKALAIQREIGDRQGEASSYGKLGTIFESVSDYAMAKECFENALAIRKEIGDRKGEQANHGKLGKVLQSLGQFVEARKHVEKALAISKEIGDRGGEAGCYGNLGVLFQSLGDFLKAKEHYEKAIAINREIGDRSGEATSYELYGILFESIGQYEKAKEHQKHALAIWKEIGDRNGEASSHINIGKVCFFLSDYVKAKEYLEKSCAIQKEIGDRSGEADSYGNLGTVYKSLGEHVKAKEYYEKALAIDKETGNRNGEAILYGNIGSVFLSLGKYAEANEYLEKVLEITTETGNREGESAVYGNFGEVFAILGDYEKAKEFHEKALAIRRDIGHRKGEAADYVNLGGVFECLGECVKAEEYYKKGLAISEEIGDVKTQFKSLCKLAWVKLFEGKIQEGVAYLLSSTQKCEDLQCFPQDIDRFTAFFSDEHIDPYRLLTFMFCMAFIPKQALYISELGRTRALADLLTAEYSVKNQFSVNPQSLIGIEKIMRKESNCTCLYLSYIFDFIHYWVINASGVVLFRTVNVSRMRTVHEVPDTLDELFANENISHFGIVPEEHCEDRSLKGVQQQTMSHEEDSRKPLHAGANQGTNLNLPLCYQLILAPVADVLKGREIIIVPERALCNVPFAALPDGSGKYLSETFRIRVIPSLTTLKIIQDSPANYHSQTGALIVGNPDVGRVHYKLHLKNILPLPCAEREAIMIGEKLGVKPLIGQEATKQAVLQVINSASLIHFAAHGDAERGEIALAPLRPLNKIPREEDYLLTTSDISKVQLRAKLVVLSCCHSGRGHVRAEGVVGIARAFLGSGARSVLVAFWALEDSATKQFMNRFYEHLVIGESASECLHEAMTWMRCNGYSDVRQWAPFMLIGDNVTFDFRR